MNSDFEKLAKHKPNEEIDKKIASGFPARQEKRRKLFDAVHSAQQITNDWLNRSYSK